MLNIGVSGETRAPITLLFEESGSRGDINAEPTARRSAPVNPPDVPIGIENGSLVHVRKSDSEYVTSRGCAVATSGAQGDVRPLSFPGIEVRPGDRQPIGGTRLKYRRSTTWRKTFSIDPREPSAFANGDRANETPSTAGLILAGVPGRVETTLSKLTSVCGSVGSSDALYVGPTWHGCGEGVGDLDGA